MNYFFTGYGSETGSFALMVIALICAVLAMIRMTGWPTTMRRIGMWLISMGWLVIFFRLLMPILVGHAPEMAPAGQVGLALLGAGTIFYILGESRQQDAGPGHHPVNHS